MIGSDYMARSSLRMQATLAIMAIGSTQVNRTDWGSKQDVAKYRKSTQIVAMSHLQKVE